MQTSTICDSSLIDLPKVVNEKGNITAINNFEGIIPFTIKRVFYLYDIPGGESRGGHAHKKLEQFVVAASGSFELVLSDGEVDKAYTLSRPYYGVYIPPGLWGELQSFSSGAISLVLTSDKYNEADYMRSKEEFKRYKKNYDTSEIRHTV